MPGILPMKVIKVGTNAQTRIAQACDRCRSKKIRCDGIRPTCSQCANVGFECKTSDKLSRRAFPRGYTESLEERVRVLEQEVRELKELLDEKDEKIDMLTRIHSQSPHVLELSNSRRRSSTPIAAKEDEVATKADTFKVQQSPHLEGEGASSYFAGSSSTRMFLEAFKRRVQETGRSTADIDTDRLLDHNPRHIDEMNDKDYVVVWKAPPRLLSDQLINIFFQEWAPLFPILHRPTFLGIYEKYVADSDFVPNKAELAQLNLVFGIAALSNNSMRTVDDLTSLELQWKAAIDAVLKENSIATLQALLLAQIFCILKDDMQSLLTYKGLSMTLSARLGLHQSQKRFALGTLTCETRKKIFWTLYAVDCFTALILGMPRQLKDEDIQCEFPVDADDEYVTERGFTPTLPGESTKLSSALALFRATRILSKILEEVFPAKASYDLSLKKLSGFSDELENWSASLPQHLRLQFVQDKPSTGTINSRSPILSLMYHYIRALIQRPVVCASLGTRSSSAMISMASSCKHMVQIIQLLNERGMSFSFCLNRDEVLVLSGLGLLFQGINLDASSKILKDNSKMINAVIGILDKANAPCASEFKRVARSFIPESTESPRKEATSKPKAPVLSRHNSDGAAQPVITSCNSSPTSSTRKNLKAIASRFTSNGSPKKGSVDATDHRRATVHNISLHPQGIASQSVPSLQPPALSNYKPATTSRSEPARSPVNLFSRPSSTVDQPNGTSQPQQPPPQQHQHLKPRHRPDTSTLTNLDYLSFGNEPEPQSQPTTHNSRPVKTEPAPTDWERIVNSLDTSQNSLYDIYTNSSLNGFLDVPSLGLHHPNHSAQTLDHISFNADLWALAPTDSNGSVASILTTSSGHPASVLSFCTDERDLNSSTEDFTTADWVTPTTATTDSYRGICMPEWGDDLGYGNSWETPLNL